MLPQSLGPFNKKCIASVAAGMFQLADQVYTRSKQSYDYAVSIGCSEKKIRIVLDYSVLAPPHIPDQPDIWADRVCLVPSVRMLDKTTKEVGAIYLDSILRTIQRIYDSGLKPFILVHQQEDRALAKRIKLLLGRDILIVDPSPCEAKGIIASSRAVVASRYHALVSALSQGVPAIGTGWTHKYIALFNDYQCREYLIESIDSEECLFEHLRHVLEGEIRESLVANLKTNAVEHKKKVQEMFNELCIMLDK